MKNSGKSGSKESSLSEIPVKSKSALSRTNSDETISVIHIDDDNDLFFVIDGLAARIWDKIDGKKTLEGILKSIPEARDFEPDVLNKKAIEFIKELREVKLVERA